MANVIPTTTDDIVERIAQETLARRGSDYAGEVRRLLDAALAVMRERGTTSRTRVADIVAAAGLSNDAFYRHFASKDDLVAALLDDGAERLASYVAHQMGKESTPAGKVRRWVDGVLAQTKGATATTTLAVLSNAGSVGHGRASGRHFASERLAALLRAPLTELGSADPEMDASLVAHAVLGMVSDHLWRRDPPSRAEIDHICAFSLRAVTSG
jgi:AcrR family transcriptional regulator